MIKVSNVSMCYRLVNDKLMSLKAYAVAAAKKQLKFKEFWVFKDISFEVEKGDVVGIIGRNGAGKSTLLKIISGVLSPTKGSVEVSGNIVPMLELGSGFDFDLSGRENIFLNGSILGYSKKYIQDKFDDIVEFSELGEFIDSPVRTYSSGMYMRLAFSVAINVDAEILLIDEILAVGDAHFQEKCFSKLEELKNSNKTIVIVSHSLQSVKKLCTRFVWIHEGKIKMDGNEKVIDEYMKVCG